VATALGIGQTVAVTRIGRRNKKEDLIVVDAGSCVISENQPIFTSKPAQSFCN